jgi:hypothetical protein
LQLRYALLMYRIARLVGLNFVLHSMYRRGLPWHTKR